MITVADRNRWSSKLDELHIGVRLEIGMQDEALRLIDYHIEHERRAVNSWPHHTSTQARLLRISKLESLKQDILSVVADSILLD